MRRSYIFILLGVALFFSAAPSSCSERIAMIVDQEGVETKVTNIRSSGEAGFWNCYLGASRLKLDLNKVISIVYIGINEKAKKNEWWRKTLWTVILKDGEKLNVYGAGTGSNGKDQNYWKGDTSFGSFIIGESKIRKITFSEL